MRASEAGLGRALAACLAKSVTARVRVEVDDHYSPAHAAHQTDVLNRATRAVLHCHFKLIFFGDIVYQKPHPAFKNLKRDDHLGPKRTSSGETSEYGHLQDSREIRRAFKS